MQRLKRALAALTSSDDEQLPEPETVTEPPGVELTIEQRLDRVEVEIGDLWEHLKRWSARQAARARRDIEANERAEEPAGAVPPNPSSRPISAAQLVPGSKAWREYQKSLIRNGESA